VRTVLGAIIISVLLPCGAPAQSRIEHQLRSALASLPHSDVHAGVCIIDIGSGKTIFAENADTPLTPASTMKLFAMVTALTELGPDFAFETILATDGTNLIVIGDGDPAFGDEKIHRRLGESITADFERWAGVLLESGVGSIPGDLIIDESIFDDQWAHPSWEEGDLDNWYAAPVGALNFNDNCVDVTVRPDQTRDAPALITIQPETTLVKIVNKCRSSGTGTPVIHHPHDTFEYIVSGRCAKHWPFASVSFPDPGLLFADSLWTALAKKSVAVRGTIRRKRLRLADGTVPPMLTILGRRTTALSDVLLRIGKNSQNLFAECLLKRTAYAWAKRRGLANPQGSWPLGSRAVLALVERCGINTQGLVIADGSGLSRDNTCSARQMASLLAWMHARGEGRLLHDSLSTSGVDGSLRKRLTNLPGRVHAKTGTMKGVSALSGYVDADTGRRYAFAIIFNGYRGPSTPYKRIQDDICRVLSGTQNGHAGG